jgi:hypothetical protein
VRVIVGNDVVYKYDVRCIVGVHVAKLLLFTGYSGTRKEIEYRTQYPDNKRVLLEGGSG